MDAQAIVTIGAVVTAATQIVKRAVPGDVDQYGVLVAGLISLAGVLLWVYSSPIFPPDRTQYFEIGSGWIAVFSTAVGIYETVKLATVTTRLSRRRKGAPEPVETPIAVAVPS